MKLLGMGSPPARPAVPSILTAERSTCFTHLHLSWEGSGDLTKDTFPVHQYQLQRQAAAPIGSTGSQRAPWVTVYEGPEVSAIDTVYTPPVPPVLDLSASQTAVPSQLFTYRLVAWNMIGRSEYTYLKFELSATTSDLSRGGATDCEALSQSSLLNDAGSWYAAHGPRSSHPVVSLETIPVVISAEPRPLSNSSPGDSYTTANTQSVLYAALDSIWNIGHAVVAGSSVFFQLLQVAAFIFTAVFSYIRFFNTRRYLGSSGPSRQQNASRQSGVTSERNWDKAMSWFVGGFFYPVVRYTAPAAVGSLHWIGDRYPAMAPVVSHIADMVLSLQKIVSVHVGATTITNTTGTSSATHRGGGVPITTRQLSNSSAGYYSSGDEAQDGEDGDDDVAYKCCSICQKGFRFKVRRLKWRKRHHCCRCLSVFCGDCGIVNHIGLLQCPVPGSCMCMKCAGIVVQAAPATVEGIALPQNQTQGGSTQHGVVSVTALEMHNRAVPPIDNTLRSNCESDDDFPNVSSLSSRSTSLRVNYDPPVPERVGSTGSSRVHSGETDMQRSYLDGEGMEVAKPGNGGDAGKGSKLGSRSFLPFSKLMGLQDGNVDGKENKERIGRSSRWKALTMQSRNGDVHKQSPNTTSHDRKTARGLPPKPPSNSGTPVTSFQSVSGQRREGDLKSPSPPASPLTPPITPTLSGHSPTSMHSHIENS